MNSPTLPRDWERVPLKHVARLNDRDLSEETDPDYEFRYVDIASVGRGTLVEPPRALRFSQAPSRARRLVRGGDTLVSTVRTYLRAVWTVDELAHDLVASTGFAVVSPSKGVEGRFLSWWLQSDDFIEDVVARSVGVSYPAISPSQIGRVQIPIPPRPQQRAIADFLDRETARIDALIEKKLTISERVQQRFWAAFSSRTASGEFPLLQLRRAFRRITDGPFGSAFSSSDYVDNGVFVVRLGNIGFAEFRYNPAVFIPVDMYGMFLQYRVSKGNLLMAALGDARNHAGRACVAPQLGRAIVKGKCLCAEVDPTRASADFLALLLSSPLGTELIAGEARGSTRSMINVDLIKHLRVPMPDRYQQEAVAREFLDRRSKVDAVVATLQQQVQLLQERRQALITAAVTGQMHIPSAA